MNTVKIMRSIRNTVRGTSINNRTLEIIASRLESIALGSFLNYTNDTMTQIANVLYMPELEGFEYDGLEFVMEFDYHLTSMGLSDFINSKVVFTNSVKTLKDFLTLLDKDNLGVTNLNLKDLSNTFANGSDNIIDNRILLLLYLLRVNIVYLKNEINQRDENER